MKTVISILILILSIAMHLRAQAQSEPADNPPVTIFPHTIDRYWVSGQINLIFQAHVKFPAKYSAPNSFRNQEEQALSRLLTLYTGAEIVHGTELLFDVESAEGRGLSDALGLAGFTNVDVVRNPELGAKPYISRMMLHQTIALSEERIEQEAGPFYIAKSVPLKRLEFRIGKFSTADFFDTNIVGGDSHLQFTNWTTVNNGAYDYAADTRGYTYGVILEYQQPRFGVLFGEMLMPKVANGIDVDWDLPRSHSENVEIQFRPSLLRSKATTIRAIAYWNTANMGDYREAIAAFKSGIDPEPNIEAHRHQGTLKYGFGLNVEQALPANLRGFLRIGWNEGQHESFAYTEVNNTVSFGIDLAGKRWHRALDKMGSAFVSNGLSSEHAEYL